MAVPGNFPFVPLEFLGKSVERETAQIGIAMPIYRRAYSVRYEVLAARVRAENLQFPRN
jgi:hypothetical protein